MFLHGVQKIHETSIAPPCRQNQLRCSFILAFFSLPEPSPFPCRDFAESFGRSLPLPPCGAASAFLPCRASLRRTSCLQVWKHAAAERPRPFRHPSPPCLPQRCQQVESPTSFCSWMSASSSPAPAQTGPASGCRHPPMPSNEGTPPFRRQNAAPTPKDEDGVRILQTGNIPRPRIIPSAATDGKAARPKDRTRALRPQIGEAFTL